MSTKHSSAHIEDEKLPVVVTDEQRVPQDPRVPTNFFFNFLPVFLSQEQQENLDIRTEVSLWQAWILSSCEGFVLDKVRRKDLPADDTLPSQLKRASYRVRVLDVLLSRSGSWTLEIGKQNVQGSFSEQGLGNGILEILPEIGIGNDDFQKTLGLITPHMTDIAKSSPDEQSYWFMLVNYPYDNAAKCFNPVIRTVSYIISPPSEPEKDEKFQVHVRVSSKKFMEEPWKSAWKAMDQDKIVRDAESLLAERTFTFAVEA